MQKSKSEVPIFDKTKLEEYETITPKAKEIMDMLSRKIFIIENYIDKEDDSKYSNVINVLIDNMLHGFEHKEFRDCPVKFRFHDTEKEEVKVLPFRHFIINMILWQPMILLDPNNLDEHLIVPESVMRSKISPSFIKSYFDRNYITKYNRYIPMYPDMKIEDLNHKLNEVMADTTYLLVILAAKFSKFMGISSNIEVFMELAKKYPEFNELIHFKLEEGLQASDIEHQVQNALDKQISLIMDDNEFNILKPLLQNQSGLNRNQFKDLATSISLKPDEKGVTMDVPVNKNYLTGGGLNTIADYYKIAIGGRKAQVVNNEFMGRAGYLLILTQLSVANVKISKTVDDCGSVNPIPFTLSTDERIRRLNGRYYIEPDSKKYKIISYEKDKEYLKGKTLYVRSPITCACKNEYICKKCYGELYYTNVDLVSAGIYSSTYTMNPVVQGIMQIKHYQLTRSSPIVFPDIFYCFFRIFASDVILDPIDTDEQMPDGDVLDITEWTLVVRRNMIECTDMDFMQIDTLINDSKQSHRKKKRRKKEEQEESLSIFDNEDHVVSEEDLYNMPYYTTEFQLVQHLNDKFGRPLKIYVLSEKEKKNMFMHIDFINQMKVGTDEDGDFLYIALEDIHPEEFIFKIEVLNNELTKPMKQIQNLINTKEHEGCSDYESLANKMLDLIIEAKISSMSIHAEMVLYPLIKKINNIMKRPDFKKVVLKKDYTLVTVLQSLLKNKSINTGLSISYLSNQLVLSTNLEERCGTSKLDPMMRLTLDDESLNGKIIPNNHN